MDYCAAYQTILGRLTIGVDHQAVVWLAFGKPLFAAEELETPLIREAYRQLTQYCDGQRRDFDLPLNLRGTTFQIDVWQALRGIPYGQTKTYGQIAAEIGRPKACRAVGMANNKNPLPIFIPCHRVIGADGNLTGYGGGLAIKQKLLDLEHSNIK